MDGQGRIITERRNNDSSRTINKKMFKVGEIPEAGKGSYFRLLTHCYNPFVSSISLSIVITIHSRS
jgi:hypothetical protein